MTGYGLWDFDCDRIEKQTGKDYLPKKKRKGTSLPEQGRSLLSGLKGCGFMLIYPVIDMEETGKQLKWECERRNITPKELQDFLGLAALQSIYGWFQGRSLPSLDNFYALSRYLGIRMEELVIPERNSREVPVRDAYQGLVRRMMAYFGYCLQAGGEA